MGVRADNRSWWLTGIKWRWICSADLASYFELTKTDKMVVMQEIIEYIYNNKVDNYADFLITCIETSDEWFDVAINYNTLAINKMIDGIWQKSNKVSVESYKYRNNLQKIYTLYYFYSFIVLNFTCNNINLLRSVFIEND